MASLVQYCDSDEEDDGVLETTAPSLSPSRPVLQEKVRPAPVPVALGLSSLPAPTNSKRQRRPVLPEPNRSPTRSRVSAETRSERLHTESPEDHEPTVSESHRLPVDAPKILIDDEVQGPSAIPVYEPPSAPHIVFRGRVVPPPPGLVPPPGLKTNGEVSVGGYGLVDDLPADHSFVNGLRKGNILDVSQEDLRRFELSRPVDPLGATRGELIQSEIAAGLWTSKQGQLLTTAQATFNQSRRHHINSMATTAALMEESIRQQASVGQDRRRMAKAKYGW